MTPPAHDPHAALRGSAPAGDSAIGISWDDPAGWKRVPTQNAMRKATFEIPPSAGDSAPGELAVFYFGADQGGSVEANMQRWIQQFSGVEEKDVVRSDRAVNDLTQHIVEIGSGDFVDTMAAMRGGDSKPRSNQGLLGAVVEAPTGKYFFKFTGPANTVKENRAKFFALMDSVKAN